ncbi:MAG TPA: response regulator [Verrucomicrobiae bacterium]|nr:response regulator [Verrucomicrobiae bacterium]
MNNILNKSVLIVDDDARMLRALAKVLTGAGAIVTCASWAGDAIEVLTGRQRQMDLVITDLRMPLVTGLTVVYAIHEVFPGLPIVVLTALGSPEMKAECLRQGASAFLEKPLNTAQLVDVVEKVFARRMAGPGAVGAGPDAGSAVSREASNRENAMEGGNL